MQKTNDVKHSVGFTKYLNLTIPSSSVSVLKEYGISDERYLTWEQLLT